MIRLELPAETEARLRAHAARVPGRTAGALVRDLVERHLVEHDGAPAPEGLVFTSCVVKGAARLAEPFTLAELLRGLGMTSWTPAHARLAGVALRGAGFRDQRMRLGGPPTRRWVPPGHPARIE